MTFNHPLARTAKVWPTAGLKGKAKRLLVIVADIELDKEHGKYKADKVDDLSEAARKWIEENPTEAVDFILLSRPRDWSDHKA